MYSLGCGTKPHLKTAKNCARPASIKAKNRKLTQKLDDSEIKRGSSPIVMCAGSYEKKSKLISLRVKI